MAFVLDVFCPFCLLSAAADFSARRHRCRHPFFSMKASVCFICGPFWWCVCCAAISNVTEM